MRCCWIGRLIWAKLLCTLDICQPRSHAQIDTVHVLKLKGRLPKFHFRVKEHQVLSRCQPPPPTLLGNNQL